MRLNKFIAQNTEYSRRGADELIARSRVKVNGQIPNAGQSVKEDDVVTIDDKLISTAARPTVTLILNKPRGYVCSRRGQGSKTIYELIPKKWQHLNSVGRLDKDSSGLLLLTNDGNLANSLTHPSYQKTKIYVVELDTPLQPLHQQMISDHGISLDDGRSQLNLEKLSENGRTFRITMHEGRNRQIRRTFSALGYNVISLHRIAFGHYKLNGTAEGQIRVVS